MILQSLKQHPLRRELSLAVVIKLILLFLLWMAFFRAPPQTNPQAVANTLFTSPANVTPGR